MGIMNPTVNSSAANATIQKSSSYRFDYNYPDPWPEDILYNRFDEAIYDLTLYSGVVEVATVRAYNYTSWQEYFPGSLQQNYTWNTSAYAETRYDRINLHCHFKRATGEEFEEDYNWTVAKSQCGAPTSVSVASTNVAPNSSVKLSWSGAKYGNDVGLTGYEIWRATSANGTYTKIATVNVDEEDLQGSTYVTSPATNSSYYYKVKTIGNPTAYSSELSSVYATLTTKYTNPSTPSLSISANYVKSGNVTLTYSASGGTNNTIKAVNIYRNGTLVATDSFTATSSITNRTYSVPCNPTAGGSYTYTVVAVGQYSNSSTSSGVTVNTYSDPSAPTVLTLSNTQPALGANVTLSWERAAGGSFNAITGYRVFRATSPTGTYTKIGNDISTTAQSGSMTVTAPSNSSTRYYYKVMTLGARSNSAQSAYISLGSNSTPSAPTLNPAGKIYNSRPRLLITVGNDVDGDLQKLAATGWQFSRSADLSGGDKVLARKSTAQSSAGSFNVTVTQTDPVGASAGTTKAINYQVKQWTDNPVVAGATQIKAAHITELQDALDDICNYYNLGTTNWIECVAGQTSTLLWSQHILQIELTIRMIADAVNAWDPTTSSLGITLPALPSSMVPEATVIEQLRAIIPLL